MTYRVSLKDVLETMNSERARLERRYQCSERFTIDALEWVATTNVGLPHELCNAIRDTYKHSSAFRTVIDDAEAGEVRW